MSAFADRAESSFLSLSLTGLSRPPPDFSLLFVAALAPLMPPVASFDGSVAKFLRHQRHAPYRTQLSSERRKLREARLLFHIKLILADHMCDFNARKRSAGGLERLECLYRAGHLLDEAVILLDNVIEIFGPPNGDQPVATAHDK